MPEIKRESEIELFWIVAIAAIILIVRAIAKNIKPTENIILHGEAERAKIATKLNCLTSALMGPNSGI